MMKAFQVNGIKEYQIIDAAIPNCNKDEVLVKVSHAGICGSDLHIIHGQNPFVSFPRITGHEFAGIITEIGANVKHLKVSDRVCINPAVSCGKCYPCRNKRSNVCVNLQVIGVHRNGGFAQTVNVPATNVYSLPDNVELYQAALIEPYSIASNVLSRMQVYDDDNLLIYGAGVIGLCILQMAQAIGIEKIAICDLVDNRLQTAKSLGAQLCINPKTQNIEEEIMAFTNHQGIPLIADAACVPSLFKQMLTLVSPAGRIGLLGFSSEPSELSQIELIKKEVSVVGSRLNNQKFAEVIRLMSQNKLDPDALISHRIELADMPDAIKMIETQPDKTCKVMVNIN